MRAISWHRAVMVGAVTLAATMMPLASSFAADNTAAGVAAAPAAFSTVSAVVAQPAAPNTIPFDQDKSTTILLTIDGASAPRSFVVADPGAKATLAFAHPGDRVVLESDDLAATTPTIKKLDALSRGVDRTTRLIAFVAALLVIVLAAAAVTGWQPQKFLLGADNRFSNSKTQIALWFGTVATIYLMAVGLRVALLGFGFIGGVGMSENLIVLSGLSAISFGGAKAITVNKIANANASAAPGAAPAKPAATQSNFLADLVQNDSQQFDIGDFQMILIALAAAGMFALTAFHFLGSLQLAPSITLPDIDSTLLSGFGLGQGAYLIKKAASDPGDG